MIEGSRETKRDAWDVKLTVRIPVAMMERVQKALDTGLSVLASHWRRSVEEAVERLAAEGLRHFVVPLELDDASDPWK